MLTNIIDVDIDILLFLPYSDIHYSCVNKTALNVYKNNDRIQNKLKKINTIVSDLLTKNIKATNYTDIWLNINVPQKNFNILN
jgi:hypothetical protein